MPGIAPELTDRQPVPKPCTLALIGGTGLNEFSGAAETLEIDTPYGAASGAVQMLATEPLRILFLPRHGSPHRFPPHKVNYRANIWALKEAGADHVLGVYAVGGMGGVYSPGALAAPDQLIDYTWGRQHSFSDSVDVPLQHVDFTWPFAGPLRLALLAAAATEGIALLDKACLGVFQGPRLETAAEVRRAAQDGCDIAGMTALPEAALARELGLDYAGLAVVSNFAAGIKDQPLSEDNIAESLHEPMQRVRQLVQALAGQLAQAGKSV
ncbi:MAG: S-methyl-5'-thioinosine phosphorylase [Xanthomonadales bacterium]|nr:S-methyl-5'-thioinosine phosphorylase [Xanthomonadales bacterium]